MIIDYERMRGELNNRGEKERKKKKNKKNNYEVGIMIPK
jgi:hypothetical protein